MEEGSLKYERFFATVADYGNYFQLRNHKSVENVT